MSHLSWGSVGERGGGGKGGRCAVGQGVAGRFPHEGAKGTGCRRARRGEARSTSAGGVGLCRGRAGGYVGGVEAGGGPVGAELLRD